MKQAKYSLNLFTIVLFVILNIASSITLASEDTQKPDQPTVSQRKYSPMSVEEARQLVEKHIKNNDVPPPLTTSLNRSSWKLPETGLSAQGIKIDDNDYVIFAQGKPTSRLYFAKKNLSEFLPKIPTLTMDKDIVVGPFYVNGVIFSSVDLEVVNNLTLTKGGGGGLEQSKSLKKVDICGI